MLPLTILIVFLQIIINSNFVESVDHMPCTENVDAAGMALAGRILDDSTPPGYRLQDYYPVTQTGRNPHRWICQYQRVDNVYSQSCDYLTEVRGVFRRECPLGCEISQILVSQSPNREFIQVQLLVNCLCRKIPRRRRQITIHNYSFQRERATCF